MDFTKSFIKAKNPCAEGFRWYLRHHRDGSDYQQVLDDLVSAGRIEDACWLLDKVGPANTVLQLDRLECNALVFAGTVEVRGSIDVDSVLRAGGSIRCGGTLRAGREIVAGDDVKAAGGVNCTGDVRCQGSLLADWHSNIGGSLRAGELKVGGSLSCTGSMTVAGAALCKGDLLVGADCTAKALSVRGKVQTSGYLRIWQGLICDASADCGGHLDAGWGIKSGGEVVAAGAIRAGESIEANGEIRAGTGYGVFAGLCVQSEDWDTSARVTARTRPASLMSGFWTGTGAMREESSGRDAAEMLDAH
jgi:cytoskeletal protein CcmA (bactofilin family)